MMILIHENLSSPRLAARLQAAGHDVVPASDVGLLSASDARVLARAVSQDRCVLTRDDDDFTDPHGLVMVCKAHLLVLLIVRFEGDPRHNLTDRGIVTAPGNLEASGVSIPNQLHN